MEPSGVNSSQVELSHGVELSRVESTVDSRQSILVDSSRVESIQVVECRGESPCSSTQSRLTQSPFSPTQSRLTQSPFSSTRGVESSGVELKVDSSRF